VRAYIYPSHRVVEPLGCPAGDTPLAQATLGRHQWETLRAAGLEPHRLEGHAAPPPDGDACLLLADDLLVSEAFLRRFLAAARREGRPGRCRVQRGAFEDYFPSPADPRLYPRADGDRLYDLYYLPPGLRPPRALPSGTPPSGAPSTQALPDNEPAQGADPGADAAGQGLEWVDITLEIDVPRTAPATSHALLAGREIRKPLTREYLRRMAHWPDVVLANVMWLFAGRLDGSTGNLPPAHIRRRRRDGVIIRNSFIAPGVEIDPFTLVEDSVLGEGVSVGSHCRIKGCVVGPGAFICNGTKLAYSVLGEAAIVNTATINFSLIGADAHIGSLAIGDSHFDHRSVSVDLGGRRVDTGLYILGFGCGPGARIASGLSLLPGTTIPAGVHLHPADAVGRVPPGLPRGRPMYWLGGRFRDLSLRAAAAAQAPTATPAGTAATATTATADTASGRDPHTRTREEGPADDR